MHDVQCAGCGFPLKSDVSAEQALAEIQRTEPQVDHVNFLCQVCMALQMAANPDTPHYRPEDD